MNKDRIIKFNLLRYFVYKYWYPQLEVDVLSKQRMSTSRKLITDIDVLGLYPDITGNLKKILGDCKTLKGQSPITRTLWMKGLMEYLESEKAIIILSKDIEKEHQLTSNHLDIQLLSEKDFEVYSKHTANYIQEINSALTDFENWDRFFEIGNRFPTLKPLQNFSKADFWNEPKSNNQLRHSLYVLRTSRSELNPANNLHLAITLNHFSLVAIALNEIITRTFNRYLLPTSKQELDNDLKVTIWGGIENYEYLNELRKKFSGNLFTDSELSLPNWDLFIEFIRATLEYPMAVNHLPLFLKELAFCFISPNREYNYAELVAKKDRYITTYAIRLTDYLVKSCSLPTEFKEIFSSIFMEFQ